jgi:hypothetical protein
MRATNIDEREMPRSIRTLSPTRDFCSIESNAGGMAGIPHLTSGSSSSGSNMGVRGTAQLTMWNAVAGAPEAFNMDLLKAGLDTVETMSCEHADLKGRVGKLEGRMENWEKKLNEIKSTFATDAEIDFMTSCLKVVLDNMKTRIKNFSKSNSYFYSKISGLEESMENINEINKEATLHDA